MKVLARPSNNIEISRLEKTDHRLCIVRSCDEADAMNGALICFTKTEPRERLPACLDLQRGGSMA